MKSRTLGRQSQRSERAWKPNQQNTDNSELEFAPLPKSPSEARYSNSAVPYAPVARISSAVRSRIRIHPPATDVLLALYNVQAIGDTGAACTKVVRDLLVVSADPVTADPVVPQQEPAHDRCVEPMMQVGTDTFRHLDGADDRELRQQPSVIAPLSRCALSKGSMGTRSTQPSRHLTTAR